MRFDFFEFVESIFKGFVFFVYNAINSLWELARRPRRGPIRLHRAYLREETKQIGGLTLLFLILFVTYSVMNSELLRFLPIVSHADHRYLDHLLSEAGRAASAPPSLDARSIWGVVAGALLGTVFIDASARIWLRARLSGDDARRALAIAAFEYSLAWPALLPADAGRSW